LFCSKTSEDCRQRCADVVHARDVRSAEQDQNDDASKTLAAGKPTDDGKISDMSKVEVRNICCVSLILITNGVINFAQ